MDRRKFSLSLLTTASLAACGGGGGGGGGSGFLGFPSAAPAAPPVPDPVPELPPAPPAPELATPTALAARVVFGQTIPLVQPSSTTTPPNWGFAPSQANVWDLESDFSIADGGSDQFDGALRLSVSTPASTDGPVQLPYDQTYTELQAFGPEFGPADGVKAVSFTDDASFSQGGADRLAARPSVASLPTFAYLHVGGEVRLSQQLSALSGAVAPLTLQWQGDIGDTDSEFDQPIYFRVVLRDANGAVLDTCFEQTENGTSGTWGTFSLQERYRTDAALTPVFLCFEQLLVGMAFERGSTIHHVSLSDGTTEFIRNADYANNGEQWTVTGDRASQNLRSGTRTLEGLAVTRMFYTEPTKLWGRMTDEFHNPTAQPITATISYYTNLGSDRGGVSYATPGAETLAVSTWDGDGEGANGLEKKKDRDVGWVHGTATLVDFTSASAKGVRDGSGGIDVKFDVTVPAGATVSLVNFLLLSGATTGVDAVDTTARATAIDAEAVRIATTFRTDFSYQRGMTQLQLDTLKNF